MKPRVAILVSYYNGMKFMPLKLKNLSEQTVIDQCETIFIDANSKQGEIKLVKEFAKSHKTKILLADTRITLYKAWNWGIEESSTRYICQSNIDDILAPNAIELMADFLDDNPNVGLVYPRSYMIHGAPRPWGCGGQQVKTDESLGALGPFTMWRRGLHDAHGVFDKNLRVLGDARWFLKLRKEGVKFAEVQDHLVNFCVRPDSLERARDGRRLFRSLDEEYLRKHRKRDT